MGARVDCGDRNRNAHAAAANQRRDQRAGPLDLALRDDLVSALRLMPGTFVVQAGQLGAQTSLFMRGGNSDANKILLDGVMPAIWAAASTLARSRPRLSSARKSIAGPTPTSTARVRAAAWSA